MALIFPDFLDSVVALGVSNPEKPLEKLWSGTGFVFGRATGKNDAKGHGLYHPFLITNKHVIEGKSELWVKFNPQGKETTKDFKLAVNDTKGSPLWKTHPDGVTDIAVTSLATDFLQQQKLHFYFIESDHHVIDRKGIIDCDLTEGDPVFILGYPMGLVASDRQDVICRSGRVARIRDYKEKLRQDFLVEAFIFPGNSGGPVFTEPYATAITGTKSVQKCSLIGMVQSFLIYKDIAYSLQTGKPRITFEENSGLAPVIPCDKILETIEQFYVQGQLPLQEKPK